VVLAVSRKIEDYQFILYSRIGIRGNKLSNIKLGRSFVLFCLILRFAQWTLKFSFRTNGLSLWKPWRLDFQHIPLFYTLPPSTSRFTYVWYAGIGIAHADTSPSMTTKTNYRYLINFFRYYYYYYLINKNPIATNHLIISALMAATWL